MAVLWLLLLLAPTTLARVDPESERLAQAMMPRITQHACGCPLTAAVLGNIYLELDGPDQPRCWRADRLFSCQSRRRILNCRCNHQRWLPVVDLPLLERQAPQPASGHIFSHGIYQQCHRGTCTHEGWTGAIWASASRFTGGGFVGKMWPFIHPFGDPPRLPSQEL